MQLRQLEYFAAVAETRHFTRAADSVHVAQPSLSKQIRTLEHELGTRLFRRACGNVTLTPAGETLLPLARRILADADNARMWFRRATPGRAMMSRHVCWVGGGDRNKR